MVEACPLIQEDVEKRHLGCTDVYRRRCIGWRGLKRNFIPFCFFLTPAPLLWCWDLISEPQALWLCMPEGSSRVAQSLKTEVSYGSGLRMGRGIFLLHSLHAGLNFPSLLLVPAVHLSRNVPFLFQGKESQLFSLTWQSTWQDSKQITLLFCQDNKIWCFLQ